MISLPCSLYPHFTTKGTGVVNSGGLLSCAFKQK